MHNLIYKIGVAAVVVLTAAAPNFAFANDTNNDHTWATIGAAGGALAGAAGGPAGTALGAAGGAIVGHGFDLDAGRSRNEEKYRKGTEGWQRTHDDWAQKHGK